MRLRVWLGLAVGVWAVETALAYTTSPRPTPRQALQEIHLIIERRVPAKLDVRGAGYSSAALKQLARATDSVRAIRFADVRVWKPLVSWLVTDPGWVVRVAQADPGASPRVHYYRLCGLNERGWCHSGETKAEGRFW